MTSRRKMLKGLLALSGCAILDGCELPRQKPPPPRKVQLGPISKFSAPATYLMIERLLIRRDRNGYSAMSLVCTHQTCLVAAAVDGEHELLCPCHGSRFSGTGKVIQGPARRDLPYYELSVDEQQNLSVFIGKEVTAEWRLHDVAPA